MKRITYISKIVGNINEEEIDELARKSSENNQKRNISGVLIYIRGLFFQILEGDDDQVEQIYQKILSDERHKDVMCLKTEYDIERLFPDWAMKSINLNKENTDVMRPLRVLLENVMDAHAIILNYTQPAVFNIFNKGVNPLDLGVKKTTKTILFTDIVAFSSICENQPVEEIESMLNLFLEICSSHITLQGGEVTKYIGDCVMAYFEPHESDFALQACIDILKELQSIRNNNNYSKLIQSVYCGFGLACGEVLEGNMGSSIKKDYTIIGDAVNTASRLETVTRTLNRAIVFSSDIRRNLKNKWNYEPHGMVNLKGKQRDVEIYSMKDYLLNQ